MALRWIKVSASEALCTSCWFGAVGWKDAFGPACDMEKRKLSTVCDQRPLARTMAIGAAVKKKKRLTVSVKPKKIIKKR